MFEGEPMKCAIATCLRDTAEIRPRRHLVAPAGSSYSIANSFASGDTAASWCMNFSLRLGAALAIRRASNGSIF